jgi:hypothetical protein
MRAIMPPRLTIGIGAGLGLASSAMIQLTDINRLLLLGVLGLGLCILAWELAPHIATRIGPTAGRKRTMLPVLAMAFGVIAFGVGAVWYYIEHPRVAAPVLVGGRGGNAAVEGHRSGAQGGDAGESGLWPGGPGGDAFVKGNDSFARGGDGGNAPQADGRGGRRSRGPGEKLNLPTMMWGFGYGGRGADTPEYTRRLKLLTQIRAEYIAKFPDDVPYIEAGIDPVPENWVNKRLEEMGETWRVTLGDAGYVLPPLDPSK